MAGFQGADGWFDIGFDQGGVGAGGFQGARDDPFRLAAPEGGVFVLGRGPVRLIGVPVAHGFVHGAAVEAAGDFAQAVCPVGEEGGAGAEGGVVDIAVEGLVHSVDEFGHGGGSPGLGCGG